MIIMDKFQLKYYFTCPECNCEWIASADEEVKFIGTLDEGNPTSDPVGIPHMDCPKCKKSDVRGYYIVGISIR